MNHGNTKTAEVIEILLFFSTNVCGRTIGNFMLATCATI